jgi:type IV secretion system protein TrbB
MTVFADVVSTLLGPAVRTVLADPAVTELYTVAGDPRVWVDRRPGGRCPSEVFLPLGGVEMFLNAVATEVGLPFGREAPVLSAELPGGAGRLQGFRPPVVAEPVFVLRKPCPAVLPLAELVASGFVDSEPAELLRWGLVEHRSILVVGGTGTGKTTFLNSLLAELGGLCPDERVAILEDTPELACPLPDQIRLRTTQTLGLYDLLDAVLRASPHRIVVGEVRDGSALAMLDAWNTGHPGGLATLHANSCADALLRLGTLVQRARVPPQPQLIAATVSLLARLVGTNAQSRHLAELVAVRGYDAATDRFHLETLYERKAP